MSIEQILTALEPYCTVTIFQSADDETWSATGELRIKAVGGEFKIKSGFLHPNCHAALSSLLDRVSAVVAEAQQMPRLEGRK